MPFTVAHAAAAAPLWHASRRRLVLSAVIVGTMAPDFEYFVHLRTHRTIGHTLPGLFLLCLPASLAVLAVWHLVVKRPLAALLPPRLAVLGGTAGAPFPFWPASRLGSVSISVLAGAVSHLVWDSFTHGHGFAVRHVPLLAVHLGRGLHVYDVLQYGSGLAGMAFLAYWCHRRVRGELCAPGAPSLAAGRLRAAAVAAIAVVGMAGGSANAARALSADRGPKPAVVAAVVGSMSAGAVAVTVVSAVVRRRLPVES